MLLPHSGCVIQMQTGMLQAKAAETLHLIQLAEVYWVLGGKQKKIISQKIFHLCFVAVLNCKICALFSAIVAKLNHFQPLTLVNRGLPPRRAAEYSTE